MSPLFTCAARRGGAGFMILSLDPSLTCTGYAVLSRDGRTIVEKGCISLKDGPLHTRLFELFYDAQQVLTLAESRGGVSLVVIERPEDNPVGGARQRFKRSTLTLPGYGAAYAAVLLAMRGKTIICPSPIEWIGRGRIPSSEGDEHKEKRVRMVEQHWRLPEGSLGCKTKAGNIADAILIGQWGAAAGPEWKPRPKKKKRVVVIRPVAGRSA